jgi:hypothetical protein
LSNFGRWSWFQRRPEAGRAWSGADRGPAGFQAGSIGGLFESPFAFQARGGHIGVCSTRWALLNLFLNGNIRVINLPDNA